MTKEKKLNSVGNFKELVTIVKRKDTLPETLPNEDIIIQQMVIQELVIQEMVIKEMAKELLAVLRRKTSKIVRMKKHYLHLMMVIDVDVLSTRELLST